MSSDRDERMEAKLDQALSLIHQNSVDLMSIKKDVAKNTKDLEKHIEGVVQNRNRISIVENYIKLKESFQKQLLKKIKNLGVILSVISAGLSVFYLLHRLGVI